MTMGSKRVFLGSLTTPTLRVTPPMEGNFIPRRDESQVPLCGGVARFARRGGHCTPPPPWNHPRKLCLRGAQYGGWHFGVDCFGDLLTHAVWIIYVRGLFG